MLLAFLSWIYQRLLYRELVQRWEDAARNRAFEETDALAAIGLGPGSDTRAKLLELRGQAARAGRGRDLPIHGPADHWAHAEV